MKRLAVALILLMLAMPALVGAQNILTLPMNIIAVITNNFAKHASYAPDAKGNDFSMVVGTDVVAAYAGTVHVHDNGMDNSGGTTGGYGNYITIDHNTIDDHTWQTRYAHLSTGTFVVVEGQRVERGQLLAKSGNAGWSSGPHLHFEARRDGVPVDPYNSTDYLWTTNPPSHAPQFDIGQFPPWGIAGLDATRIGQKFRDARDAKNRFLDAYRTAGFLNVSMTAYDNDQKAEYEGRYVHRWSVAETLPPGVRGPAKIYSVLVQDVKLRALRGDGTNVFTREEALLIYNPETDMAYMVKEGFWALYMERNGPVTLGAPIGDEVLTSNGSIEQHFQRGWCSHNNRAGKLEAYDKNNNRIPPYTTNYVAVATGGGDDTYVLGAPTPPPDPVIPITNLVLKIMPADVGNRWQLNRGQERMTFDWSASHNGGNKPLVYRLFLNDKLAAEGPNPFGSITLTPGTYAIRARVEAGSGNNLRVQEVSQPFTVEAAPKSDWGVPFEVKVNTIASAGGYVYIAGVYVSGSNVGKGFLRRVLVSNPEQGESFTFGFSFNEILPRDSYLFAATSSGLMVSKNQGASWSTLYSNGEAYDIAILPGDKWNDWPIMILVGSAGGNSVCRGFWTPAEPNALSGMLGMGGFGPYTLVGGRRSREESWVIGSGQYGVQTQKGPYHFAYTNSDGQLKLPGAYDGYAGRAWAIFSSGSELWVALKTNAGNNVYYNDDYGGSSYQKAIGIGSGDDVVAFTWIDGIPGPSAITRKGILYHAPVSRTQWRTISGFSQTLGLDMAAGQVATTILGVGQNLLIGTERGLRVMPVANIKTLAAAKPAVAAEEGSASADSTTLLGNYPNPFNPETTIQYALAASGPVELRIYNMAGQVVRTLTEGQQTAGRYSVQWDGKDNVGRKVASGIYIYRLEAGTFQASRKLILLK